MLSFTMGNTTIHLWPLMILLVIATVLCILRVFSLQHTNKKIVRLCRAGESDMAIALATKQLNYYRRVLAMSKNKNTSAVVDMLYLCIAISYLGLANDSLFIQYIGSVSEENIEKHFWLALFYLLKDNVDEFQLHYGILLTKPLNPDYTSFLLVLKQYRENGSPASRESLIALRPKLKFKLLQDLSDGITKENNRL